MAEPIDRSKVKDPSEVSGWGRKEDGRSPQDYSDIARQADRNVEFDPNVGHVSDKPKGEGETKKS
jgi:hypothetical protein